MNADMAKKNPKDNLNAGSFSRAASTREFPNRSLNRNCLVRSMPYLAATCTMVNKGLEKNLRLDLPEPTRPKLPVGVPMSLRIRISQGHSEILKKKERCQSVTCSNTCHESSRGGLVYQSFTCDTSTRQLLDDFRVEPVLAGGRGGGGLARRGVRHGAGIHAQPRLSIGEDGANGQAKAGAHDGPAAEGCCPRE
jgi:hypothetical protein